MSNPVQGGPITSNHLQVAPTFPHKPTNLLQYCVNKYAILEPTHDDIAVVPWRHYPIELCRKNTERRIKAKPPLW